MDQSPGAWSARPARHARMCRESEPFVTLLSGIEMQPPCGSPSGGGTRQGHSTRRGLSSPSMRGITSTTWSVDRPTWPSSSSSWQRRCHLRPSRPGWPWAASLACARKAHKVEDNGWDETCSGAPQAARLTTLVTLRPLLGVYYPCYQISFLALGRCSTSASCSSLVEEVRPASSARGRGCRWTGQPRLANRDVRA